DRVRHGSQGASGGRTPALLAAHGPVHADVAAALAAGARERCAADWGLATTGVAGPDPQDGVPPGTVYLGLAGPSGAARIRRLDLAGDRAAVRSAAVPGALNLLADAPRGWGGGMRRLRSRPGSAC